MWSLMFEQPWVTQGALISLDKLTGVRECNDDDNQSADSRLCTSWSRAWATQTGRLSSGVKRIGGKQCQIDIFLERHSRSFTDEHSAPPPLNVRRTIVGFRGRAIFQTKGKPGRPVDERGTNYQSKNYFKINLMVFQIVWPPRCAPGILLGAKKLDSVRIRFLEFKPFDRRSLVSISKCE